MRVDKITAGDITTALTPIWTAKPDMARKVRQRIGTVLNFAHGKGWRPTEAPGRSVTVGLPRQPKGGNYRAMPYADVPAFVASITDETPTSGRQALLFQILTAARPGDPPSIGAARWRQVLGDAHAFLTTWGDQAVAMDWTAVDLFSVPPGPDRWLNRAGLVALLRGRSVVAITEDAITIANPGGGPNRFRRSPTIGAVMLWAADAYTETNGGQNGESR